MAATLLAYSRCAAGKWMEQTTSLVTNGGVLRGRTSGQWGRNNVTSPQTPNSAVEQKPAERLDSARSATQDADRVITLCDVRGMLIARHDQRPEQDAPEIAS